MTATNRPRIAPPGFSIERKRIAPVATEHDVHAFLKHAQVIEVDAPGLTPPLLHHFPWQNLPRPAIPLDRDVAWTPEGDSA